MYICIELVSITMDCLYETFHILYAIINSFKMKKLCYAIVLLLFPLSVNAEVKVEASETVELMSVLSRLASYNEFCQENNSYTADLDTWFANYKNHETVLYHQRLRQNHNIMYDAVASLGVHLTIENGILKLLSDRSLLESRWNSVDLDEFLSKLNAFYSDTKFHEFFVAHQDYFSEYVNAYKKNVLPYFHQDWYSSFFGTEPKENYWVIIGFNNGDSNYGVRRQAADGKRDVFNVCTYRVGQNDRGYAETLIHEFNHSFVNPLLDENIDNYNLAQNAGEWLLKFSELVMNNSAYDHWSTVINESIVRAAEIIYMIDNGFSKIEIENLLLYEISVGFTWTPELVKILKEYTEHRDKYKTLNDFYSQIVMCLNAYVNERRSIAENGLSSKEDFFESTNSGIKVEASETIELMSVLSRLASYNEYCQENNSYTADIDTWFANYKNHETVLYHQRLRQNHNIMYDAVASLGVHLTIENGILKLLSDRSLLESRWNSVDLDEFLSKLNAFYSDTKFHEFFVAHQDYFSEYVNAYKKNVLPYFHQDWYSSFFGTEPKENYWVIIGFNNGDSNYGVRRQAADGKRDVFNVCTYRVGQNDRGYAETLIHEFNHSFVNPLLDENIDNYNLAQNAGEWLLKFSELVMNNSAYDHWSTVINESIVRAAEIIYMIDNGFPLNQITDCMYHEIGQGFTWTPELVVALRNYSNHRDNYRTLYDFYPEIVKCLDNYVTKEREKMDQCLSLSERETIHKEIDGISYVFEKNSDTPTTLRLLSAKWKDGEITAISLPSTVNGYQVTIIGEESFPQNHCWNISLTIPEGVVEISDNAFLWAPFNHITLPSTLKVIGNWAFSLCHLNEIYIPASVNSIGMRFLNHIDELTKIVVDENNPYYDSRNNCNAVIESMNNTLVQGCKTSTIPEGVTVLEELSFIECQAMTNIIIPSWVTSIGEYAFWYCCNLRKIESHIEIPFAVSENLFKDLPSDAVLYVPMGSKILYETTQGWNKIKNIVEMDMTKIDEIHTSVMSKNNAYYTLHGQRVSNPNKGLYIHKGHKILIK